MWVFLWFLISAFILGIFAWSMNILYQQKKAWAAFAKKKKLKYESGKLTSPPTLGGMMDEDFRVSLYTDSQPTRDVRGQRYVTVIEVEMGAGLPTGAVLGTAEYENFISTIRFDEFFTPSLPEWDSGFIAKTRDKQALQKYLTRERAQTLVALFKMKKCICLFFFDELAGVLRIETTDPLRNEQHLEKVMRRIMAAIRILAPTEAEKKENMQRRLAAEEREVARLAAEAEKRKQSEQQSGGREVPLAPLPQDETS